MPANSEATVNVQLGEVLRTKHPAWRDGIGVEQSRVLREAARRPDIVVSHPGGQVVVLETEFSPGASVEQDACARLGEVVDSPGQVVEQAIAVLLPRELRTGQGELANRVAEARYRYAVLAGEPEAPVRWPEAGWLGGDANDLAACIEHAALSERQVAKGSEILEAAVRQAAFRLEEVVRYLEKDTLERISAVLHQEPSEQTTRMAMAIVANALTFHATIAGAHGIPPLDDLGFESDGALDKAQLLQCWRRILREINYWPIFKIATDLLRPFPIDLACEVLNRLAPAARELARMGAAGTHDLSGQMFQRLIVDRKFLATFYTLPASAVLLSELAAPRLDVEWGSPEDVCGLRIADLACGTGTLLNAAYQSVRARHRHNGGDDRNIHPGMMERALIASDIMPAATHLTASILSGAHPTVPFGGTRIVTMPYGEQPTETGHPLSIGSLDLLGEESARSLMGTGPNAQIDAFGTGRKQVRGTGEAEDAPDPHVMDLSHESGDLLIMNPPFTRPTNHESSTIPVPSFAGFETSQAEQKAMSGKLARLRKGLDAPAGAGNAGLASYFVDLAHVKTKPGGVVALVLPTAFVQGDSWKGVRSLLDRRYEDLLVVSIAASGKTERAFSADTGMAEVLVVGTKKRSADAAPEPGDALFVNLLRRPRTLAEAAALAGAVRRIDPRRRSGRLSLGADDAGGFVRAPLAEGGCAALREPALAEAMLALRTGTLALPRTNARPAVPVVPLGRLGRRGLLHRDISGKHPGGAPRGPFDILVARDRPLYPVLWAHDAERERRMVVAPDREGVVREGRAVQAVEVWENTASKLHFNLDFQLNSQSLAACVTPEKSIGGRAWPNFVADRPEWEEPLALWANSTLGVICFWWLGMRQQQGRAMLTISRMPDLLALDARALSNEQAATARDVFADFRDRKMLPANEAYRDPVRHELDRALLVDVLRLPEKLLDGLAALRDSWCAEPTVHGGKTTRA